MAATAKVTPIKPAAFVIETDVPIPHRGKGIGLTAIFRDLAKAPVGASVFVPGKTAGGIGGAFPRELQPISSWAMSRAVDGGVRVWKTAEPKSAA